ncbi:MAG: bifunctional (p)ppGpp synthetase/guanosine-3',5'-bis(diphosphate) 3'-pyrophosphohydrolase [Parvularculaceae bacterium]|nr:bifunctional (p)ppGpp synthetase/guanosine-3',5'-bis(diphosphate) 3'-pyrophosphohydrolase [Parvularculaceae bacterium]
MKAHGGQLRKSGDPYFSHPLAVAEILTGIRADPATVATALLHDVVEDTDVSLEDIKRYFGEEIARLVDGVTKLSKFELGKIPGVGDAPPEMVNHAVQFEQFRKFVVSMLNDVRILLVKLADRLHNMRTLHFFDNAEKRARIAQETMEIYAPLAGRIGVHKFREELENLSFAELNPVAYQAINEKLTALRESTAAKVAALGEDLRANLEKAGVSVEVHSREKKPYSIWRKMTLKNVGFEQLADIYAFRVIVDRVEDCYRALGVIHGLWRMAPEEFDDYISSPKPNGYRSIHTAVVGPPRPGGEHQRIEIQIRTRDMHELAERGVAAHWQYKDIINSGGAPDYLFPRAQYDPYETPRRLAEMMEQGDDPEEALKHAKIELFHDQVFCFTPKGQLISLPKGATSIDFAYAVHSSLGDRWIGAKINKIWMPPRTPLKNGDVVEIHTSDNAPVPPDGDKLAITGRAKAALKKRVNRMRHEEKVEIGRKRAEAAFAGAKLDFSPKVLKAALKKFRATRVEDVLAKVGEGKIEVKALVAAAYPGAVIEAESEIRPAARRKFDPQAALVGLPAGSRVRMATCCSPVPGERILGVREEGGQLAVHAISCEVWARDDPPESRLVDLSWDRDSGDLFGFAQIEVEVRNEIGVLSDVAGVIARHGVSIANINMSGDKDTDFVTLLIDLEVKNERQLVQMLGNLLTLSAVVGAKRREVQAEAPGNE